MSKHITPYNYFHFKKPPCKNLAWDERCDKYVFFLSAHGMTFKDEISRVELGRADWRSIIAKRFRHARNELRRLNK
jgi:hypothetical protein